MYRLLNLTAPVLLAVLAMNSAIANSPDSVIPFDGDKWEVTLAENLGESRIETVEGRNAIFLNNGRLDLKSAEFTTGTIEFDVLIQAERGFGGIRWHVQPGNHTHEEFYLRPHMSGNPDASQYTPVFNGVSGWQIYFGPNYSTPISYPFGKWMHVKLVVAEDQAEIYIDSDEPILVIDDLLGDFGGGGLTLYASRTPFYFANFSYQKQERPVLVGTAPERQPMPHNLVPRFAVSSAVPESILHKATALPREALPDTWTVLGAENNGIVNLARAAKYSRENNTVFARVSIRSDSDQVKKLSFGYSDRVQVYLGDQAIYAGNNGYRSRDYRYLGTVGLFDQLYLPLKTGDNELYFAVSESFGGWGLMAAFEDMAGIELSSPDQDD